ncbi:low density lipo receptor adapter 1-B-like isoform X2 [Pelobates cultripes]|uniref:Low density lipo receptor adapter 1-B-like isoform X2 n=1 Tax=Pelobates cultripes TaxID=61616 RepID=A0AAD1R8M2_PELCU|nr:low density lipo receptor adapter 1-B-like isoform X2 [Pelobates cultripes]
MDALKSAGKAILRSPSLARHTRNRVTGHHKLPENWADTKDNLSEGIVFHLKYLGMTLVEKPKGEDMAAAAIRRIITMARVGAKKFQKVVVTVTPRGISLQDAATGQLIENVSIYRISYCTTDKVQNKVFAYIAQNQSNGTLECHAFLSPKKKMAQAVTLTVAQAFKVALDLWESGNQGSTAVCVGDKQSSSIETDDLLQQGMHSGHVPQPGEEDDDDEFDDIDENFSSCFMVDGADSTDSSSPLCRSRVLQTP